MRRIGQPQQRSPGTILGEHAQRIRALEFRRPSASRHAIGFYNVTPFAGNPAPSGSHSAALKIDFAGTGAGVDLMDVVTRSADAPQPISAGMYAFKLRCGFSPSGGGSFAAGDYAQLDLTTNNEPEPGNFWAQEATNTVPLYQTSPLITVTIDRYIDPDVEGPAGGSNYLVLAAIYVSSTAMNITGDFSVQRIY